MKEYLRNEVSKWRRNSRSKSYELFFVRSRFIEADDYSIGGRFKPWFRQKFHRARNSLWISQHLFARRKYGFSPPVKAFALAETRSTLITVSSDSAPLFWLKLESRRGANGLHVYRYWTDSARRSMAINLLNPGQGLAEEASYPGGAGLDGVIMPRVAILIETAASFRFPFRYRYL